MFFTGVIDSELSELFLAKINDQVGYGLYSKNGFNKGDFIVRFCGELRGNALVVQSNAVPLCLPKNFSISVKLTPTRRLMSQLVITFSIRILSRWRSTAAPIAT